MLSPTPPHTFIALPNEQSLYQSPARTGLSLTTTSPHRGTRRLSINSSTGTAYITNQRVVYIPTTKTPDFESFACPIANLHDTHVAPPLFGPNAWKAIVQSVANGGLGGGGGGGGVELKLVFKDGGASDFSTIFERLKEKVLNARETGVGAEAMHLDELPTYEDARSGQPSSSTTATAGAPPPPTAAAPVIVLEPPEITTAQAADPRTPNGPPPGYEEAQRESVAEELERQIGQIAGARIQ